MTVRTAIQMKAALSVVAVCCALATRAVAAPPPAARAAQAEDGQAKARAQVLLSEGTAAYGRGDYAAALDKFTAAYTIFPSPKLWFNIGQANRDLGRPVEAVEAFDRFLRDAGGAPPETLAEARRSAAELKTKLGQIQVTCATDGAEITIDGKPVGSAPLGEMFWATPGRHQIAGQLEGFSPAIEDVVVEIGQVTAVDIQPRPIDTSIKGGRWSPGLGPGVPQERPIYRRGWFWVAAGIVVAAGVAAALVFATGDSAAAPSGVPETTLGAQRAF